MKSIKVKYFASLRELSGRESEEIEVGCETYAELYTHLAAKYQFSLPSKMVLVAVNDEFAKLEAPIQSGATVVFIPPVAGG